MPRRFKRTHKRTNKRKMKRFQKRYHHSVSIRGPHQSTVTSRDLVIPDRMFTKFRYIDVDTPELIISNPANSDYNLYKINSLYDPNAVLATSAIPGFVEYAPFYANYRVHGVKITVTFASSSIYSCTCFIHAFPGNVSLGASLGADFSKLEGNKWNRQIVLAPYSAGPIVKTLKMYVPCANLVNAATYNTNLDFAGAVGGLGVGTDPNLLINAAIGAFTTSLGAPGGGNPAQIGMRVRLTFYAELFNKKNNLTS